MKNVRGFAISIEAIVISGLVALILFIAFMYATNYIRAEPRLTQTILDVRLCGSVLVIKNIGPSPAVISKLYSIDESGSYNDITSQLPQTTIQPGDVIIVNLDNAYSKLLLVGLNFDKVVIQNECKEQ